MNLIDFIFPKKCLECGKEGKHLCEYCLKKVGGGGISKDHISIFKYEGVIRKAIVALKYKYSTEIAKELAEICVDRFKNVQLPRNTTLIPVPLYWYRKNFRGFNQSEKVAKIVAEKMNWDFIPDFLIKKKSTRSQVELKGPARRKNLSGVFVVNPRYSLNTMHPVLIFDDVYTTGSTLNEIMNVLKKSGVKKVWGLTIAR